MDDRKEIMQRLYDEAKENGVYYERAFTRYLIIGSAAAILYILTFYKDMLQNDKSIISFDVPLWLFSFSLLWGLISIFVNARFSTKYAGVIHSYLLMSSSLDEAFSKGGSEATQAYDKFKALNEKFEKTAKYDTIIGRVSFYLGVIPFCCAFVLALYMVTIHV